MATYPGASITQVKTVYGLPQIAFNTCLEIHGYNLVPANTPASGVDWSNAPDFANGQMPTQLGRVSVRFGGPTSTALGYIYWYCSAQTNPNCADDQINVLAPFLGIDDPGPLVLSVLNNGVPVATADVFRRFIARVSFFRCGGTCGGAAPGFEPGGIGEPLSRTIHTGHGGRDYFAVRYRLWQSSGWRTRRRIGHAERRSRDCGAELLGWGTECTGGRRIGQPRALSDQSHHSARCSER